MTLEVRPVVWLGNSRKNMQEFSKKVRSDMGAALFAAQWSNRCACKAIQRGRSYGVFEIVERYSKDAYRLVYGVQIGARVYVLHAFQKKSKSGIATPRPDVDLMKQRYREAQEHAKYDS